MKRSPLLMDVLELNSRCGTSLNALTSIKLLGVIGCGQSRSEPETIPS